jgi:hypothetical protein
MGQAGLHRRGIGRFGASVAAAVTPLTIISSVPVTLFSEADLDVILNGSTVSAWGDQSSSAAHFVQLTSSQQPTYTASDATLNNLPTIAGDGVDDWLESPLARPASGTTPCFMSAIIKQVTWSASGRVILGDATSQKFIVNQNTATPQIAQQATAGVNLNNGLAVGSWGRLEVNFAAGANSYLKLKANKVQSGASEGGGGTGGSTVRLFTSATAAAFTQIAIFGLVICAGTPTAAEISALDAYWTSKCGAGLV